MSLLQRIVSYTRHVPAARGDESSVLPKREMPDCDWCASEDIFYLINTVKAVCETKLGTITLEDVGIELLDNLPRVMQSLSPCEQDLVITVSVCGASWDIRHTDNGVQKRIRAIPKAAGLRLFADGRCDSDAYFNRCGVMLQDAVASDLFSDRKTGTVTTASALTLPQFIENLKYNNQQFLQTHGSSPFLRKENFIATMSDHEEDIFDQLLIECG